MPRSRTKWLSAFLTHGDVTCHHELVSTLNDLDSLAGLARDGTSETFGTSLWRAIYRRFPSARYVVIRRDPEEVEASLLRQGISTDVAAMSRVLDEASSELPALVVEYDHINYRLPDIWHYCRDDRYPISRDAMKDEIIAEPVKDQLARVDYDRLRRLMACNP